MWSFQPVRLSKGGVGVSVGVKVIGWDELSSICCSPHPPPPSSPGINKVYYKCGMVKEDCNSSPCYAVAELGAAICVQLQIFPTHT